MCAATNARFPMNYLIFTLTQVQDFGDIQLRYEFCTCDKFSYLIGALFVFKGLIVLCGLFLAYETRNVNYKHINDTKYVSIATYVVAIMVGVGSPMSLVLTQNLFINVAYGLAASMIISACLSCILIIQIPKVKKPLSVFSLPPPLCSFLGTRVVRIQDCMHVEQIFLH